MSLIRRNLIAVCLLISFGSLTFSGFLLLRRFSASPIDAHLTPQVQAEAEKETLPIQFVMPDQRIDLTVIPAQIQNQEWQLSNQGVSLLQTSIPSNESNGLIMYGHNWRSLLGNLHKAKIGQKINLIYADGNVAQYTIQSMVTVSPSRLDVLNLAKADTLLVYTCTGFLDSERLVVLAHK